MTEKQKEWIEELEVSIMDLFSVSVALYSFVFCLSSMNSPIRSLSTNVLDNCYQTLKNHLLQHAQETTDVASFFLRETQVK